MFKNTFLERDFLKTWKLLSYKFRETKDWLNPHYNKDKVPQNLESKLMVLHFSKAFLSGLICRV